MDENKKIELEEVPGILAQLQKQIDNEKDPEEKIKLLTKYKNSLEFYHCGVVNEFNEKHMPLIKKNEDNAKEAYRMLFYFCRLAEINKKQCIQELKAYKKEALKNIDETLKDILINKEQ